MLLGEVPVAIRDSVDAYVACLSGAILRDEYLALLAEAGFVDVEVTEERTYDPEDIVAADIVEEYATHSNVSREELRDAAAKFQSVRVQAHKPAARHTRGSAAHREKRTDCLRKHE